MTTKPPQDGTAIIARGRVIGKDGCTMVSEPFVGRIVWRGGASSFVGWRYVQNGTAVQSAVDDEVIVDWWIPTR